MSNINHILQWNKYFYIYTQEQNIVTDFYDRQNWANVSVIYWQKQTAICCEISKPSTFSTFRATVHKIKD